MTDSTPRGRITEDMVEAALLGAMGYDAVHDDDETPKGDDYFRAQMRAALEAANGVAAGCTAVTAGAPVSPVQTTADLRVSEVTDEMVERAAEALSTYICCDPDQRNFYMEHARLALEAALAGSVSPKGDNTDV